MSLRALREFLSRASSYVTLIYNLFSRRFCDYFLSQLKYYSERVGRSRTGQREREGDLQNFEGFTPFRINH